MRRPLVLVGASSNIGIRPYDDGRPRGVDRAPGVLRRLGLASWLDARDTGDVSGPAYRDFVRPQRYPRNEIELLSYCEALAARIAPQLARGHFPLVIGGDCSIMLGNLLGLHIAERERLGLVYLDAHADFATQGESRSGSVASMCLAMAVGRGDSPLARLVGRSPLVADGDVALVGRRDEGQAWYGHDALRASDVLDLPHDAASRIGYAGAADLVLDRVARAELEGFWIHLDTDVLAPSVMPAVDSPEPGGPGIDDLVAFLGALVRHPKALGMEVTIYDPLLDPGRESAWRLIELLGRVFRPDGDAARERLAAASTG
jgi:arginase